MSTSHHTPCDADDQHIPAGLTAEAWAAVGAVRHDGEWHVPERSAEGEIVGWSRRLDSGGKRSVAGGSRGLTMPWPLPPYAGTGADDPVCIVEGATDTAAGIMLGLDIVGRPSATGGADALRALLRGRHVAIIGENDDAGRAGANKIARALVEDAASVRIAYPPEGTKDLRAWATAPVAPASRAEVLAAIHTAAPYSDADAPGPVLVRLADVAPEPIRWLWPGRVALGKLTVLASDPGLGKSTMTMDMAARISRGTPWPDAPTTPTEAGGVVLLTAEDDLADTVRPRLDAAGADASRVMAMQAVRTTGDDGEQAERTPDLSRDMRHIEQAIELTPGCRLVIIDPISAYLGGTDSHRDAEVRGLLAPLAAMAERHGVAVLAISHLRKGAGAAIYRTMGSLAFVAAARAAWAIARDQGDEERRLLLPQKNNIAADQSGLAYRLAPADNGMATIAWEPEPVHISADEALREAAGGGDDARTERDEAADWLRQALADGPIATRDLQRMARDAGHTWRGAVRRARDDIGIEVYREGYGSEGRWYWRLPSTTQPPPIGAQPAPGAAGLRTFDGGCAPLGFLAENGDQPGPIDAQPAIGAQGHEPRTYDDDPPHNEVRI